MNPKGNWKREIRPTKLRGLGEEKVVFGRVLPRGRLLQWREKERFGSCVLGWKSKNES